MTHDDGVTQTQSTAVDLAAQCTGIPPTIAVPTTVAPASEPDRFILGLSASDCGTANGGAFVRWDYIDYADGHYAARVDIDVLKDGAPFRNLRVAQPDPASDGAETDFDLPSGVFDLHRLEVASYSLSLTVTYEDGATDQHVETFNLGEICNGRVNGQTATTVPAPTTPPTSGSTTTTVPSGTLPETGSSDLTWSIGAVAGLLTTAGAALFAGVRRSRND
jgi:LPXTG-motif cell wall-anchored protein